jgi:hypothetical protein
MRKKFLVLMVLGFVNWQFMAFALGDGEKVLIKWIVSNPAYYDGKIVKVEGEVEKVHYATSGGDPYTLFRLTDSEHNLIGVFSEGHLLIYKGTKVRVTGEFKKEEEASWIFKFKNVIEAKQVEKI